MGRKQKYFNDTDKKNAIKKSKTQYMLSKSWKCDICDYNSNLASKWMHIKTKKHITNSILAGLRDDDSFEIIDEE